MDTHREVVDDEELAVDVPMLYLPGLITENIDSCARLTEASGTITQDLSARAQAVIIEDSRRRSLGLADTYTVHNACLCVLTRSMIIVGSVWIIMHVPKRVRMVCSAPNQGCARSRRSAARDTHGELV